MCRYLIQFAVEAYEAAKTGSPGPPIGRGIAISFGLALMQVLSSLFMNQYVYRGMMVGGQARAGLIGMIFSKSLRISGRARAGAATSRNTLNDAAVTAGERERRRKAGRKNKRDGEGVGWSNGKVVNLMGMDSYRVDQAASWFHVLCGFTYYGLRQSRSR